jgi:hypothetical protein
MKTPLTLNGLLATAGIAAVLLSGCVSSRKYKASQAELQQVRNDSARLAQQVASLNENTHTLEQRNTSLQRSLDSSSSSYASQKRNLDYYQDYFNKRQSTMAQVSDELKSSLSQAGLANEDIQQTNDAIYVSLDENKVFKKNSTAVTKDGKQALNSLAQVIKNRSDVNVVVSNGDSSTEGSTAGNMPSSSVRENSASYNATDNMSANTTPRHHRSHHSMANRRSENASAGTAKPANETSATATTTQPQNNGKGNVAVVHKRKHRKYSSSEGSMAFSSNEYNFPKSRSWALKQRRVNTVAGSLLQNGVPKVNVLLQQPISNGSEPNNNIKVIITPVTSDFNPQRNSSAKAETR